LSDTLKRAALNHICALRWIIPRLQSCVFLIIVNPSSPEVWRPAPWLIFQGLSETVGCADVCVDRVRCERCLWDCTKSSQTVQLSGLTV